MLYHECHQGSPVIPLLCPKSGLDKRKQAGHSPVGPHSQPSSQWVMPVPSSRLSQRPSTAEGPRLFPELMEEVRRPISGPKTLTTPPKHSLSHVTSCFCLFISLSLFLLHLSGSLCPSLSLCICLPHPTAPTYGTLCCECS